MNFKMVRYWFAWAVAVIWFLGHLLEMVPVAPYQVPVFVDAIAGALFAGARLPEIIEYVLKRKNG